MLKMILGQGMAVIGVGLVAGLAAAFGLMRLLRSLLFGVGENDPLTFVAITVLLMFWRWSLATFPRAALPGSIR